MTVILLVLLLSWIPFLFVNGKWGKTFCRATGLFFQYKTKLSEQEGVKRQFAVVMGRMASIFVLISLLPVLFVYEMLRRFR